MANKSLFRSILGKLVPSFDSVNEAGGAAYARSPRQALAQYAATGCLNMTFYATAEEQLDTVMKLSGEIDAEFLAKTAVYCRERGHMKDMPALLCAILSKKDGALLKRIFSRVIDNGKMLRNFVQILRSGVTGRKSLGSLPKKLVQNWFDRTPDDIFKSSVGQSPSMGDILKMTHPKPVSPAHEALFAYLIDKPVKEENLPELITKFEAFKKKRTSEVPAVPFQLLTALDLQTEDWKGIARNIGWHGLRMNLNTFQRHDVFSDPEMIDYIAKRLSDETEISKARVFPYQLLSAFINTEKVPLQIREALQDAMEISINNVPRIDGDLVLCPDVSGSMRSPVTGYRAGATTKVRCIDVAGLLSAAFLRRNKTARVIPFEQKVVDLVLNGRDTVMTNAEKLAKIGGGGTSCSAPLSLLNSQKARADMVIYVSDNESWADSKGRFGGRGTAMMEQWSIFKARNPKAKLVCIDITPSATIQTVDRDDILNVGGFSDSVFELIQLFSTGKMHPEHWAGVVDAVSLN
ncbi:MAG: RNA-binding protein [Candidatus Riflebacteria bacterium]|nr:RNA-binding protein [Candidatus Riflebacteria bacterium]